MQGLPGQGGPVAAPMHGEFLAINHRNGTCTGALPEFSTEVLQQGFNLFPVDVISRMMAENAGEDFLMLFAHSGFIRL